MLERMTFQELKEKFWVLYGKIFQCEGKECRNEPRRESEGVAANSATRN